MAKPGTKMRQNLDELLKMKEVQCSLQFNNLSNVNPEKKGPIAPSREFNSTFQGFETTAKSQPRYLKASNNQVFSKTFVAGVKLKKQRPKSSHPITKQSRAFLQVSRKNIDNGFFTAASESMNMNIKNEPDTSNENQTQMRMSYKQLRKDIKS